MEIKNKRDVLKYWPPFVKNGGFFLPFSTANYLEGNTVMGKDKKA
jgi:hypothetical protein